MLVRALARSLPKAGNAEEEYEDAFWPADGCRQTRTIRCAVADGATETSFSGLWARGLVEAYGRGRLGARRWPDSLHALRGAWRAEVGHKPLPWYAEEKLRQGAYAAFLGLTITVSGNGCLRWSAVAIGDCCLFQVREDRLITCYPLEAAGAFSNRPRLLGSICPPLGEEIRPLRRRGSADPGDRFLLMSDALACWFLSEAETGAAPWEDIETHAGTDFVPWIARLRSDGLIRNDDVTLLALHLE